MFHQLGLYKRVGIPVVKLSFPSCNILVRKRRGTLEISTVVMIYSVSPLFSIIQRGSSCPTWYFPMDWMDSSSSLPRIFTVSLLLSTIPIKVELAAGLVAKLIMEATVSVPPQ